MHDAYMDEVDGLPSTAASPSRKNSSTYSIHAGWAQTGLTKAGWAVHKQHGRAIKSSLWDPETP